MTRRRALLASVALVVWALVVVPMPVYETRPGAAYAVEELVVLSASTGDVHGDLSLLTVRRHQPNLFGTLAAAVDPDRELDPANQRTPPGIDLDTYLEIQRDAFDSAFVTAVALAAREAGYDVPVVTDAVVARVLPGGPASEALQPGDRILTVDGTPVDGARALIERLGDSDEPRQVTLGVRRDDRERSVVVMLGPVPQLDGVGLGIMVETVARPTELPFDADLDRDGIVGPSAGLMIAVTATDLLLEEDLAAGRTITGTGTIAADGRVGPVGGIEHKARVAVAAGADLMLVPVGQLEAAVVAADGQVEVVGVETLADALAVLRGSGQDLAASG